MKPGSGASLAIIASFLSLCALSACGIDRSQKMVMLPSLNPPQPSQNEVLVALEPDQKKREGRIRIKIDSNGLPTIDDFGEETLVRGKMKVGEEQVSFFLPAFGPHPVTSKENHSLSNTSTLLTIDSNGDAVLDRHEDWWSSLPVRLGDQMFEVRKIDPGSKWILFSKSSARLSGVVVGKQCPGFQFVTADGRVAALADYKGRALLLDVWSMT